MSYIVIDTDTENEEYGEEGALEFVRDYLIKQCAPAFAEHVRGVSAFPVQPVALTERQIRRIRMTITNYEFRWQVERPDAAQRASDDLALLIPLLRLLVDMPELSNESNEETR